jgi:Acetyltransferase (GNAT) domain
MKVQQQLSVRRYEPSDAEELRQFDLRMYGAGTRQLDDQRFSWLYERNPAREGDGYDYWLCEMDGLLIGHQAEVAFDLSIRGRERRRAAWGIDLMVDLKHRARRAGPSLIKAVLEHREVAGSINLSVKGMRAVMQQGLTDMGIVPVYVRPLDVTRIARSGGVPRRLRRVTPVAGPALRAVDAVLSGAAAVAGLRLERVERFDARVDEVWARASQDHPLLAVRDAAATSWRIDERPDRDQFQRYYLRSRGRTLGYVAMRRSKRTDAMVVLDYLAPTRWVAPLLTLAAFEGRRQGAAALVCKTLNPPAEAALRRSGFVRRDRGVDPAIGWAMHCGDPELAPLVLDPANWFITSADGDLEQATADGPDA